MRKARLVTLRLDLGHTICPSIAENPLASQDHRRVVDGDDRLNANFGGGTPS